MLISVVLSSLSGCSSQDLSLMARLLSLAEGSENESPQDVDALLSASQGSYNDFYYSAIVVAILCNFLVCSLFWEFF